MKKRLYILAKKTAGGILLSIRGKKYSIQYPEKIWKSVPSKIQDLLVDNISFASTSFLGIMLNADLIEYNTPRPLLETFFFQNHIYDLLDTERVDHVAQLSYMRKFYNTEYTFQKKDPYLPCCQFARIGRSKRRPVAIIPFTFGKESLLNFAITKKLGMHPVLVYIEDPVEKYERDYKLKYMKEFREKFHVDIFFVKNSAGALKSGLAFRKKNDIGWGIQTTLLSAMLVPFVYAFDAKYIFVGSEFANNEFEYVNGWKLFHSYDEHPSWTSQKNIITRLLSMNRCQLKALFEPIDEMNIFYMLHHDFHELSKYQFSCRAEKPLYKNSQWCHKCYKCARMYLFAKVCGIPPEQIGFRKNLLTEKMFSDYLYSELESGSTNELDFAFSALLKIGYRGSLMKIFQERKLRYIKKFEWYVKYYTQTKEHSNLPEAYRDELIKIYRKSVNKFRRYLQSL